jgi:hypothetical protein
MKAGKFNLIRAEVEGWMLVGPADYFLASSEEIEEKTGGCGPGKIGDWFVPDTMYGESVFLACQIHDWMYREGESLEDKKIADRVFLWNMTVLLQETPFTGETENSLLDVIRLRRVMTYFSAVYYGGADCFEKGNSPDKKTLAITEDS